MPGEDGGQIMKNVICDISFKNIYNGTWWNLENDGLSSGNFEWIWTEHDGTSWEHAWRMDNGEWKLMDNRSPN